MDIRRTISLFILASLLTACGGAVEQKSVTAVAPEVAFDSLITYMERSGDFINSPQVPAMISASAVYNKLDSNILVIDMRSASEFAKAHIPNSINVPFTQVLNYFEGKINPSCFDAIVMVCNAGQTASYTTSILRFLGYDNVFALKWGFSSWHKETAQTRWLARRSSKYSEVLQREANRKNPAGEFPKIETAERYGFAILRERAHKLFADGFSPITLTADTLFESGQNFYIANYWPEPLYNKGHIPGAIQYQPKKSLKRTEQLNTLPLDKTIVVYCFTGQHSAFVTAYLRLLGYDARTLVYGANSFMHSVMVKENTGNAFTEKEIYDLPVTSGSGAPQDLEKVEVVAVPRGGC
jgi:rhodanese-related sulfurtransferase